MFDFGLKIQPLRRSYPKLLAKSWSFDNPCVEVEKLFPKKIKIHATLYMVGATQFLFYFHVPYEPYVFAFRSEAQTHIHIRNTRDRSYILRGVGWLVGGGRQLNAQPHLLRRLIIWPRVRVSHTKSWPGSGINEEEAGWKGLIWHNTMVVCVFSLMTVRALWTAKKFFNYYARLKVV
jgi:hypothetical protein